MPCAPRTDASAAGSSAGRRGGERSSPPAGSRRRGTTRMWLAPLPGGGTRLGVLRVGGVKLKGWRASRGCGVRGAGRGSWDARGRIPARGEAAAGLCAAAAAAPRRASAGGAGGGTGRSLRGRSPGFGLKTPRLGRSSDGGARSGRGYVTTCPAPRGGLRASSAGDGICGSAVTRRGTRRVCGNRAAATSVGRCVGRVPEKFPSLTR